jgi:signal transduction histidine kinase
VSPLPLRRDPADVADLHVVPLLGAPVATNAAERERERLSWLLHDHVLQDLMVARQDLAAAEEGDLGALAQACASLDAATGAVRAAVRDLHPPPRAHLELERALAQLGDLYARHTRCVLTVEVDGACDPAHVEVVLSLARELIRNAQLHAGADYVSCRVRGRDGGTELQVRDDGCGFALAEADAALAAGHIGLASCRSRVDAVRGRFTVRSGRDGTSVVAWLPPSGP